VRPTARRIDRRGRLGPRGSPSPLRVLTVPHLITIGGYAASLAWVAGGSPWLAVAGLAADEADGRVARLLGQASSLGSALDWAVDLTMTGLAATRLGAPWLWILPPVTVGQAMLRARDRRPSFGSARFAITLAAIAREWL
jgi:hypothetical protein